MRAEYDFSGGVRGKYAGRIGKDVKLVVLDPDVATAFGSSQAVNRALRSYLTKRAKKTATRATRTRRSSAT
jgi:hypothetical protein